MILYKRLRDYTAALEDMIVKLERMKYDPTASDDEFDSIKAAADYLENAHTEIYSMIKRHDERVLSNIS